MRAALAGWMLVLLCATGLRGQQASHAEAMHEAVPFGIEAYPDRPLAAKDVLDRGKAAFSVNCSFCHGADAGGGSAGPNLLRSEVVLRDAKGELIAPIVHGARVPQGMPKIEITDAAVTDIAAWLHSLKTGGNMVSTERINVVVGKAEAGKVAFAARCATCHSVDGDLKGFAAKFKSPQAMQQTWIFPGVVQGPGVPELHVPPVTATVSGVTGKLGALDDFYVEITSADGVVHRIVRDNGVPKVAVHDPLAPHRAMFRTLTDKEIHDVTAYLEALR